jgi:flagellar protein FlaG
MVTEVKSDNVISVSDRQSLGSGVQAVQQSRPLQQLPGDGKELPQKELPQKAEKAEMKFDDLKDVVRDLNQHIQQVQRELQFSVDKDSGRTVITVMDKETQEVIRKIPGEEALHFARKFQEQAELEIFSAVT